MFVTSEEVYLKLSFIVKWYISVRKSEVRECKVVKIKGSNWFCYDTKITRRH